MVCKLRTSSLFLATACALSTCAQKQGWLSQLLNGDTTLGPDYDTAYITSYRNDLVLSPVLVSQSSSLTLEGRDGRELEFATNSPVQYGLALDYKWLGVEATFSVPGMSELEPELGTTNSAGLGFGYTGRSWWFRNFLRHSEGFYIVDPEVLDPSWEEGDPYPLRPDLENLTYMASINHGFNTQRYSQTAALWQMERQKHSAGSWIAGATFWYSRTRASDRLLPPDQDGNYATPMALGEVRRWTVSLTGGYAHTWSLWGCGFVNIMIVPGVGMQQQQLRGTNNEEVSSGWGLAGTSEFRFAMGYSGDKWYAGLTTASFVSNGDVVPDVRLGTGYGSVRVAAGWRIKGITSVIPAIGL